MPVIARRKRYPRRSDIEAVRYPFAYHLHNGWQGVGDMGIDWPADGTCPPDCTLPASNDPAWERQWPLD